MNTMLKERMAEIVGGSRITEQERADFLTYASAATELTSIELNVLKVIASAHCAASSGATVIDMVVDSTTNNVTDTKQEGDNTITMLRTEAIKMVINNVREFEPTVNGFELVRIVNQVIGTDVTVVADSEIDDLTMRTIELYAAQDEELVAELSGKILNQLGMKEPKTEEEKSERKPVDWAKVKTDTAKGIAKGLFGLKRAAEVTVKKYGPEIIDISKDAGSKIKAEYKAVKAESQSALLDRMEEAGYTVGTDANGKPTIVRVDGKPLTQVDIRAIRNLR